MIKLGNNIIEVRLGSEIVEKAYLDNELIYEPPIKFEDSVTELICLLNWDTNNKGFLTKSDLSKVTSVLNVFKSTQITKFNEFLYFTGLSTSGNNASNLFTGSTLLEITMPPTTFRYDGNKTDRSPFYSCSQLTTIHWNNCYISSSNLNLSYKYIGLFSGCSSLDWYDDILPPGCDEISELLFNNTKVSKIIIPEGITYCGVLKNLNYVWYIEFPTTLTVINGEHWFRDMKASNRNQIVAVFKGLNPPTLSTVDGHHDSDMKCYVPDESYDDYVTAFSGMSRFIVYKLSTLPEEYRDWGTLLPDYANYFED